METFQVSDCLPSDTKHRLDYQCIVANDLKTAQLHRDKQETQLDSDKKARKLGRKNRKA